MKPADIDQLLSSTDLSVLGEDPTISEFWKAQLRQARASADAQRGDRPLQVIDVVRNLGYGFRKLPAGMSLRKDPEFAEALKTRRFQTLPGLTKVRPPEFPKDRWEHLCAVGVLTDGKLVEEYLDFIAPLGIRSDMSAARHYYYMRVIRDLWERHAKPQPFRVIEIGAGAGNLAIFLLSLGIVSTYVIVDLAEMLLNAAIQIREFAPKVKVRFGAQPEGRAADGKPAVHLIRTVDIEKLEADQFTLALNFNSFMEMDRSTRDRYIREIYRTAKDGAVFYNVNRRQASLPQADGTTFDNNPLLYPYSPSDDIIFWEDDPFQTAARAWFASRPSLAIARAARIRKDRRGLLKAFRRQ